MNHPLIYTGKVRHRRFVPKLHAFSYQLFLFYFDIGDIEAQFKGTPYLGIEKFNWFTFRRRKYWGDPTTSLDESIRIIVREKTGKRPFGKIYLLSHLTCLGYCFNPISIYFVFKVNSEELECLVLEVTNTPWGEKHIYVLTDPTMLSEHIYQYHFKKALHVSPFMAMNYEYLLNLKRDKEQIIFHMQSFKDDKPDFDATLSLNGQSYKNKSLSIKTFLRYPLITYKVTAAIYWQALKLWLKGIPFHPHPKKINKKDT